MAAINGVSVFVVRILGLRILKHDELNWYAGVHSEGLVGHCELVVDQWQSPSAFPS